MQALAVDPRNTYEFEIRMLSASTEITTPPGYSIQLLESSLPGASGPEKKAAAVNAAA